MEARTVKVGWPAGNKIANGVASASSTYPWTADYSPSQATDGNQATRWAADGNAPGSYWQYDFGFTQSWNQIRIMWESSYATAFEVQTSSDGQNFNTIHTVTNGTGGLQTLNLGGSGRFMRLKFNTHALPDYGISIYDVGVF
jgi:hypothetical protein